MNFNFKNFFAKFKYNPNSVKKDYDGRTDIYLAKVSYRFFYLRRWLMLLIIVVLIAFLLSGNISYQKLFYLTKDINLASDYVSSVHDTITYNVGNSQSFAAFRSGIAVASRERLSIFSSGGRELFSSNHAYGNPTLKTSDQYILLYDVGGKQFSLYNSFSKLNEGVLNHPIYDGFISQSGTFALVTKSEDYDSVVKVYHNNGTKYDYNFSKGRVASVSLSQNGLQIAVLLIRTNKTEISTELRLYKIGSNNYSSAELTFSGIPYEMKMFDGGNIAVIGEKGVNVFNSNLSLIGEYLSDSEIYSYSFGNDNIVISHSNTDNAKTEVVVLNKRGKIEKKLDFEDRVMDIAVHKNHLFVQKINGFERINISVGLSTKFDMIGTDFKMIIGDKNTLIICNSTYAKFLIFN